jgi:hypothetical protein
MPAVYVHSSRVLFGGRKAVVQYASGSDDVISSATVQWSNEQQEWELADTFAKPAHCNTCKLACEIVWLPLN